MCRYIYIVYRGTNGVDKESAYLNFHRLIIDDGLLMLERKFEVLVPLKERLPELGSELQI